MSQSRKMSIISTHSHSGFYYLLNYSNILFKINIQYKSKFMLIKFKGMACGFCCISLRLFRYFNSSVLRFLQKFNQHKNALLANVNLSIHRDLSIEKVQSVLAQILTLIGDNINSLELVWSDLRVYSRLLNNIPSCSGNNDEFSELVTNMLTRTRILSIDRFLILFYRILMPNIGMHFFGCRWPRTAISVILISNAYC
jgi:hypothetical protein